MGRRIATAAAVIALFLAPAPLRAQRFTAGMNVADLMTLGTLSAEGSVSVARSVTVHAGTKLNPWEFRTDSPDTQFQMRQMSLWAGARWWPWHVYSGWWAGADARWTVYNEGGISDRVTEEGNAYGAGLYGGYGMMLSDRWNIDIGAGFWGGWKVYRSYACPVCGRIMDEGEKLFMLPDARITVQYVF
mgnify:CR=1 FL=1